MTIDNDTWHWSLWDSTSFILKSIFPCTYGLIKKKHKSHRGGDGGWWEEREKEVERKNERFWRRFFLRSAMCRRSNRLLFSHSFRLVHVNHILNHLDGYRFFRFTAITYYFLLFSSNFKFHFPFFIYQAT